MLMSMENGMSRKKHEYFEPHKSYVRWNEERNVDVKPKRFVNSSKRVKRIIFVLKEI